jgi:hypothetical protein
MDINELKSLAEARFDHALHRKVLHERIQSELHVTYNGGQFKITTELLAFLATYRYTEIYLEDIHRNPIKINRDEFRTICEERYQTVMNTWHQEFEESKKIRKGKDVI